MQRIAISLGVIVVALLTVGAVTGLVIRHIVQVAPIVALLLVARKRSWFAYGAVPVSLLWFALMFLTWLYLLFDIRILTGTFTPIEIVLTIVIGGGLAGIVFTLIERPRTGIAAFVVMAALQTFAIWLSLRPAIVRR
jgi:hypothetical protein